MHLRLRQEVQALPRPELGLSALGRAIGLFALLGLFLTLAVHIAALNGVVLLEFWEIQPLVWCTTFVAAAAGLRIAFGKRFGLAPPSLRAHPRWLLCAAALLVVYAAVDFSLNVESPRQDWAFILRLITEPLMGCLLFPVLLFLRPRAPSP